MIIIIFYHVLRSIYIVKAPHKKKAGNKLPGLY